jgi:hypothetical protein
VDFSPSRNIACAAYGYNEYLEATFSLACLIDVYFPINIKKEGR